MSVRGWRAAPVAALLLGVWVVLGLVCWMLLPMAPWLVLGVLGLAFAVIVAVLRAVVAPLVDLSRRADAISIGDWDALAEHCYGVVELEHLRRALKAMAEHVRRAQSTGSAYAAAISEGQEEERARLARELHDATVQSLIAVAQRLERAARLIPTDPERARVIVAEARQETVATVDGLRATIAGLRPPALDELGLVPALELLIARLASTPPIRLAVEGPVRRLAPERELAVLRIAQEALSNVSRHAHAASATVRLCFQPRAIVLVVEDDGRGFAAAPDPGQLAREGHWGLIGVEERAARFGGHVEVDSRPGQGTRLTIVLPEADILQPQSAVVDPVCKATILPATAYGSVTFAGERYYFCCPVCQGAFGRDPAKYAGVPAPS